MTSLLKSKFDTAYRRALFLSADKLAVYHWENGKLGNSYLFDVSADGQKYFDRYLKETGRMVTYLLVDFVEEEYRQDTIPHVFGADRDAVILRKKSRLFRDTPYFYATIQDRETEGRKDDVVLFMGLTNPDLLAPWLKLLLENKTPLAGIYSVPQLTKLFLESLPQPSAHMLVVSLQSISGLRQTFFLKQQLKISRLVDLPRYGTKPYAPIIHEEVEILQRYLNNMHLTSADQPLHIYYLADTKLLGEIKKTAHDTGSLKHFFVNINQFGQQAGMNREITNPFSDPLFNFFLLKHRPGNYYARKEETRYHQMLKAGRAMYAASICMLLTGMIWGGINFIDAFMLKRQAEIAVKKADFYSARYQMARERLPQTPVSPADLEIISGMADTLDKYKVDPLPMLGAISQGMDQFPQIRLDEIQWVASADPNTKISDSVGADPAQGVVGVSNIESADTGYAYYQIAALNGQISPFDGNYRAALDLINRFAETLRTVDAVHDVSVVILPLDTSSEATLQGGSGAAPGAANFSIRIVLGIRHES